MIRKALPFIFLCLSCISCEESGQDGRNGPQSNLQEEVDRLREKALEMDPALIRKRELRDSLCNELCDLVLSEGSSKASIDSVVQAGADPDCICSTVQARRRFGSRIPIVKGFMRSKVKLKEVKAPALCMAVFNEDERLVRILVDAGANPDTALSPSGKPLNLALWSGNSSMFDLLIDLGADPKGILIANARDEKMVDRCLKLGLGPQGIDFDPALKDCDKRLLARYFKLGARPEKIDHFFLLNFCQQGSLLPWMLEKGMDPDVPADVGRGSLLQEAITAGTTGQVKLLLEAGADPNKPDGKKELPLERAITLDKIDVADLLLAGGADANAPLDERSGFDARPMEAAIRHGSPEMVALLLRHGARVAPEHGSNLEFARKKKAKESILEVLN